MAGTKEVTELRPSIKLSAKGKPFEIFCCAGTTFTAATLKALQHVCEKLAEASA